MVALENLQFELLKEQDESFTLYIRAPFLSLNHLRGIVLKRLVIQCSLQQNFLVIIISCLYSDFSFLPSYEHLLSFRNLFTKICAILIAILPLSLA